ncbi:MAG: oxidoreductase [Gammaproteobacteria bacterium]|jgi:predicted membrane-bound spermidine synthase
MSIVWERTAGQTCYQVRRAGGSLRLYTNGVLHSQYNPARPMTGSVWDLLTLPAFFTRPEHVRRVLVLGIGGGAVIRQLQQLVQPEVVVGVELDRVHLSVARRFFGVRGRDITLIRADAVQWLRAFRGPRFDMIVDDLFTDADGQPARAVPVSPSWGALLLRHIADQGMAVINFPSRAELEGCGMLTDARLRARYACAFRLSTIQNENAVGVFCKAHATTRQLRDRLKRTPGLDPGRRARYRIRTLSK